MLLALQPLDGPDISWIEDKFKNKPLLAEANKLAMKAGYSYCEATEAFQISYEIPPAQAVARAPTATSPATTPWRWASSPRRRRPACRCSSAAIRSRRRPTSCTSCRMYKDFGVMTFQAEDEIAAITSAIGAAYGGALALTTTSGPGMALKTEAIGPGGR